MALDPVQMATIATSVALANIVRRFWPHTRWGKLAAIRDAARAARLAAPVDPHSPMYRFGRLLRAAIVAIRDWALCEPNPISDFGAGAKIALFHLGSATVWTIMLAAAWFFWWPLGAVLTLFFLILPLSHLHYAAQAWKQAPAEQANSQAPHPRCGQTEDQP